MTHSENEASPQRKVVRTIVVIALAAFVIGLTLPNVIVTQRATIINVTIGRDWMVVRAFPPLSDAGLRPGDRIDPASLSVEGRIEILNDRLLRPGERLSFTVVRDGRRHTLSVQGPSNPPNQALMLVLVKRLTASIFIIVGVVLLLVRPCRMTWGFYLFALGSTNAAPFVAQSLPVGWYALLGFVFFVVIYAGLGTAGLWMFAARFPSDSASGWRANIDRAAPLGMLFVLVVSGLNLFAFMLGWQSIYEWNVASSVVDVAVFAIGMLCLVGGYIQMTQSERQRLKWVVTGFAISLASDAYQQIVTYLPGGGWPQSWAAAGYTPDILAGLHLFIPATVAYAVLKHHVLDVNFVISRALVFGALTTLFVGVFALVDWFFTKQVAQQRLAVVAEIGVALGFGFGLNGLHRRMDSIIDRVLFRRRHLAEERLNRSAAGVSYAKSFRAVDDMLVKEPAESLGLVSAAVFRRGDQDNFQRKAAVGWSDDAATELNEDDPLVLSLQAERGVLRLRHASKPQVELPAGIAAPVIALPLTVRYRAEAIVFYGAHQSGEDFDPDELRVLERLAQAAAGAYDHIEAETLRRRNEELAAALEKALATSQTKAPSQ